VVAIYLQADEKKVVSFGHLKYHPVYMTLGNLPYSLRMNSENWKVIAYLPVLHFLESETNKESTRALRQQVFSRCLELIIQDFEVPSVK
jgi:hypothetical protein